MLVLTLMLIFDRSFEGGEAGDCKVEARGDSHLCTLVAAVRDLRRSAWPENDRL